MRGLEQGPKHQSEQALMEFDKQNLKLQKVTYGSYPIDKLCKNEKFPLLKKFILH